MRKSYDILTKTQQQQLEQTAVELLPGIYLCRNVLMIMMKMVLNRPMHRTIYYKLYRPTICAELKLHFKSFRFD